MKSIGVDVAFNYKTTKTAEVLDKEGPINVCVTVWVHSRPLVPLLARRSLILLLHRYWDNVGGESLEAAIEYAAKGARFIVSFSPLLRRPTIIF